MGGDPFDDDVNSSSGATDRSATGEDPVLMHDDRSFLDALVGDGRPLLMLSAIFLLGSGAFAIFQASTGQLLPHDTRYLGMTADGLCAYQGCRILHFMVHDRISFGGVLIAISVMYLWLIEFPLRRGESWAWRALGTSGLVGFLSFLSYLGYGYLDSWHGAGTLVLLPVFFGGIVRARRLGALAVPPVSLDFRSRLGLGRALLLLAGAGIAIAGLVIMTVGMTTVFVPQDLEFIGETRAAIGAIHPHLLPLIAHDRAGFGGALASFGVAMLFCLRYGRSSAALWQALAIAGAVGFGTTIGVHPAIGYLSVTHLGPAVLGGAVFATGLGLAISGTLFARP
jgi:hypothetical protein